LSGLISRGFDRLEDLRCGDEYYVLEGNWKGRGEDVVAELVARRAWIGEISAGIEYGGMCVGGEILVCRIGLDRWVGILTGV
jgi:hypothetical protein